MERKSILVRSEIPGRSERVPVVRSEECVEDAHSPPDTVRIENRVNDKPRNSLDEWVDYFSPSIEKLLPTREHTFAPVSVSVEREEFYRDERVHEPRERESPPRRVRVVRRRVTLYGIVNGNRRAVNDGQP